MATLNGWQPQPNNPYKWYHVVKDTFIKGVLVNGFDVCLYQWAGNYQPFTVDENGQLLSPPFKSTIWFMEFFEGASVSVDFDRNNAVNNYAQDFSFLPFAVEDGEIGISQSINDFLAAKYEVAVENVTE
jgi:hypothetical protein